MTKCGTQACLEILRRNAASCKAQASELFRQANAEQQFGLDPAKVIALETEALALIQEGNRIYLSAK